MSGMRVKNWFVKKIETPRGFYLINHIENVEKETEKALYVMMMIESADGEHETTFRTWVPKACVQTYEEYEAEIEAEKQRFEAGKDAYNRLVEWAKAQGVKGVRVGLKKDTILAKVAAAGLVAPEVF